MNIKNLDTFGKRLEFIMDKRNVSRTCLAENLNLAPNSISSYTKDKRKPDLTIIKKISEFLNVSSDFLLGLTDDYQTYISKKINGDLIEITFDDEALHVSQKEISSLFKDLENMGWDVNKLLAKYKKDL